MNNIQNKITELEQSIKVNHSRVAKRANHLVKTGYKLSAAWTIAWRDHNEYRQSKQWLLDEKQSQLKNMYCPKLPEQTKQQKTNRELELMSNFIKINMYGNNKF